MEYKSICELIENYAQGTFEGNRLILSGVFHEDCNMNGFFGDEYSQCTAEEYIEAVTSNISMSNMGIDYSFSVDEIKIFGNIASAVITEKNFSGKYCFKTLFNLAKINGKWKVTGKVFATQ